MSVCTCMHEIRDVLVCVRVFRRAFVCACVRYHVYACKMMGEVVGWAERAPKTGYTLTASGGWRLRTIL